MALPIRISQAILGDSVDVDSIDGRIGVKVPEGTQSGDILKVRGKGAYAPSGYGRGDLLVEIRVEVPRKISRAIKDIVQGLKKEGL